MSLFIGGPNDDDQSLDAFDDFFNSRSNLGQNGQHGLRGPRFTSTPDTRGEKRGQHEEIFSNTTMSSSNSPTASPATSRRAGNRQRSMRKAHQRSSNRNNMLVSEHRGSKIELQSNNSLENAGRHSSIDNHVESAASASGIANMQAKIQQLENDLRERGEQILQLRRDNRKVQARVDEATDALSMERATHEKLQKILKIKKKLCLLKSQ